MRGCNCGGSFRWICMKSFVERLKELKVERLKGLWQGEPRQSHGHFLADVVCTS